MLKPRDTWNWFYDEQEKALMLDLGNDMLFRVNIPNKLLVDCAYTDTDFTVDDASAFQEFKQKASKLDLSEPRQAELTLNCVAAKRFHKPVLPKSWFFDLQETDYVPCEGDIIHLKNRYGEGYFMVIEVGDNASLCALVEDAPFTLDGCKELKFGEAIKVMHNRMACANHLFDSLNVALVG
ncbi:cell division protein ZapC [Vibrio sp. TH_r3]|uniref:cell division protein ZapC n=1 Tax=Vibrio sp. TH_r3 TaxID=3082084 RepID=UPI002954677E|nr:cell division protein ZapC [Vibrio sp. TH_r3]MDV7104371.1 cell division protein ZapC [Vibrio sp. TH_r3]